jgi:hypothetical protein
MKYMTIHLTPPHLPLDKGRSKEGLSSVPLMEGKVDKECYKKYKIID